MTTIDIYRGASIFVTIKPDDNSAQLKQVMGDNLVNISFEDNKFIKFAINDYCTVFGERYQLNQLPIVTKGSRYFYRYTLSMNAEGYDLAKYNFLFLGADNTLREPDFSLMGNTDTFIDLIIANANRAGSGWIKGQVVPSDYKNLTFSKEKCYNALSRLAEEFQTEFAIEGKTIHLTKRANDTGYTFKHGRNNGLYEITRNILNNSSVITRLYAYGSDKNLPADYNGGATRLQMRSDIDLVDEPTLIHNVKAIVTDNLDGTMDVIFSFDAATDPGTGIFIEYRPVGSGVPWQVSPGANTSPRTLIGIPLGTYNVRFRTVPVNDVTAAITLTPADIVTPLLPPSGKKPQYYVEDNVALYGVIEHTEYFDDIFPHRTGVVSSIDISDPFKFIDTSIDFNVNDQLLPGIAAKVTFNTGQLAGYTFDIASFNNGTKQFVILKNKDERILDVPSNSLKPAIGDKYVLVDLLLPQSYIDAAEAELKDRATALLDQLSQPQLTYTVIFDPKYAKTMNRIAKTGDLVWIVDNDLELQKKIRVVSVTRNIVQEYKYQAELADEVSPGTISLILSAQSATGRDVTGLQNQLFNNSILNNNVIGDLNIGSGSIIFDSLPTTSTMIGFSEIVIDNTTGKLYKKV